MKRLVAKMRKVRMARWDMLSSGEKVMKVVMKLVKWIAVAAVVALVFSAIAAVVVGAVAALAIMNAVSGGFAEASRARRAGERYVRFW